MDIAIIYEKARQLLSSYCKTAIRDKQIYKELYFKPVRADSDFKKEV